MRNTHRNRSKTHNTTPLAKASQVFLPTGAATLTFSPFLTICYTPPFLSLLPLLLPNLFFFGIAIHLAHRVSATFCLGGQWLSFPLLLPILALLTTTNPLTIFPHSRPALLSPLTARPLHPLSTFQLPPIKKRPKSICSQTVITARLESICKIRLICERGSGRYKTGADYLALQRAQ